MAELARTPLPLNLVRRRRRPPKCSPVPNLSCSWWQRPSRSTPTRPPLAAPLIRWSRTALTAGSPDPHYLNAKRRMGPRWSRRGSVMPSDSSAAAACTTSGCVVPLPAGRVLHRPTPRRRLLGGEALRGWRMKGLADPPQETVTYRAVERCPMRNPRYPPACELGYDLPTDFGRGLRPVGRALWLQPCCVNWFWTGKHPSKTKGDESDGFLSMMVGRLALVTQLARARLRLPELGCAQRPTLTATLHKRPLKHWRPPQARPWPRGMLSVISHGRRPRGQGRRARRSFGAIR